MHIGLIGGIGVAATVVYYQRLTAAMAEMGKPLELTIVHADAQELVKNVAADNRQGQAKSFARLIDRLKSAGCDCAAITSLGGHFCYDETLEVSPLPLVSGITPLDDFFAERGLTTVGLLGTRVVMQTRLYGQLKKTRAVAPDAEIDTLGQSYLDMALAGHCRPDQRSLFLDAGRRLVEDEAAEAVILAGTDLNLAFDGQNPGYRVIDALDVHVGLLARIAAGETRPGDSESNR